MGVPATNIISTETSETQSDLNCVDSSDVETDYRVERSPNGTTDWTEIAQLSQNTTTYSDDQVACSTAYYYRVRAHNASSGNFSNYSNIAGARTFPCAPSNLSANGMVLNWQDNSSDETNFRVEQSLDSGSSWTEIGSVPANSSTYQISGFTCGAPRLYRVRAYRQSDGAFSGYSNSASVSPGVCKFLYLPKIVR